MVLDSVRKRWPWLKHLFADSAYDRTKLMDKAAFLDFTIEIIKRSDTAQGFEVSNAVGILAGIYILVRGMDNMDKDLPPNWRRTWDRLFPKSVR
jgi:hypothetical protein